MRRDVAGQEEEEEEEDDDEEGEDKDRVGERAGSWWGRERRELRGRFVSLGATGVISRALKEQGWE
eukprot:1513672-Rhodomonas_salina.1